MMKTKVKEVLALMMLAILFFIASVVGALLGKKMADKDIQGYLREERCLDEGKSSY